MAKSKDWFAWLDQRDTGQRRWAIKYILNKNFAVTTEMELTSWIEECNAQLNGNSQNIVLKKFRNNMWQAFKQRSKRNEYGKKSYNFILKTSTKNRLKALARGSGTSLESALETLIEGTYTDIKKEVNDAKDSTKLLRVKNARAKKTIDQMNLKNLENTLSESNRKILFMRKKIESLIYFEIKNRDLIKKHQITKDPLNEDEDPEIRERCSAAMKNIDEEMKHGLNLEFIPPLPD